MFIPLSQGKEAIVDEEDFDLVLDYGPWFALLSHGTWYALANARKTKIYMHRLVMGFPPEQVGHKDRNGLNNTFNLSRIKRRTADFAPTTLPAFRVWINIVVPGRIVGGREYL